MTTKVIGIFCIIFSLSYLSQSKLLHSPNCCPPVSHGEIIKSWSIGEPLKQFAEFGQLQWQQVLTHDFAHIKAFAEGVVIAINSTKNRAWVVIEHASGHYSVYHNLEHHHLNLGDEIAKGEVIGVPAFNADLLNGSFNFAVSPKAGFALAQL